MRDLYSILDVGRDSSNAAIKAAYRGLAKQSHPDLHLGDGEAENRTKEINYAYAILGDPGLRAAYDEELDMLAAKKRKLAFMNASAIAAGIALFVIAAAALTFTVTRMHNGDGLQRSAEALRTSRTRIATIGVPESAFANSPVAVAPVVAEARQNSSAPEEPSSDATAGQNGAPVRETVHIALVAAPQPEISPSASATAAFASAPKRSTAVAMAKARVEPDRQGVRREHAMVRRMGRRSAGQTREFETASYVRPRLREEPESWIAPRKTMARRLPGGDGAMGEIED
jgi:curved DNA-binding protein CbpA